MISKNFFGDQRGQEFSVFKLLISAVIAIAILAVLYSVIRSLPQFQATDPTEVAKTAISERLNAPGTPVLTDPVQFSEDKSFLNPSTITRELSISADQLCMSRGDYEGEDKFSIRDDGVIEYLNTTTLEVKLAVVCDDADSIEDSFDLRCRDCEIEACGGGGGIPDSGTVCAIGLRKQ